MSTLAIGIWLLIAFLLFVSAWAGYDFIRSESYAEGYADAREMHTPLPSQDVSQLDRWDDIGQTFHEEAIASSDPGAVYDQERDLLAVPLIVNVSAKRGNVFPIQRDGEN